MTNDVSQFFVGENFVNNKQNTWNVKFSFSLIESETHLGIMLKHFLIFKILKFNFAIWIRFPPFVIHSTGRVKGHKITISSSFQFKLVFLDGYEQ